MNVRALLLMVSLLVSGLAGCVSTGEVQQDVPWPRTGTTVTYEGTDGKRLILNVTDVEDRKDHRLVEHRALVVTAALHHDRYGGQQEWSRFREAIDVREGLIVHQVAVCARPLLEEPGCYDNRSAVTFSSTGLPGGLAMGPLWGDELPKAGALNVSIHRAGEDRAVAYQITEIEGETGCRLIDVPEAAYRATDIPLEVTKATVCGGSAFPVEFQEANGTRYERVDQAAGHDAVDPGEASAWETASRAVPLGPWSAPLAAHAPSDPAPLTIEEAHQVAWNRSVPYRGFFDEHPDAVLLGSRFEVSGYASTYRVVDQEYQHWYERELIAIAPDGQVMTIHVEEKRTADAVSEYEVSKARGDNLPQGTSVGQVADRQIQVGPAHRLGEQLVQTDPTGFRGARLTVPNHPYLDQTWTPYPEGYVLFEMFDEPPDTGGGGGGLAIQVPQYLVMDSTSGNLMLFETHRSNLPFS